MFRLGLSALFALIVVLGAMNYEPATAQAQPGPYPQAYGGFTWADGYGWYWLYGRQRLPYYSLYPPVYYSYPVPRPYGYSPFAYPPGVATPEIKVRRVRPKKVTNPYVEDTRPGNAPPRSAEVKRIRNPFVLPVAQAY